MNANQLANLHDEAITATREINDPAARFRHLLDHAHESNQGAALLDEAADLARDFEAPEARSTALWRVYDTAARHHLFTDDTTTD